MNSIEEVSNINLPPIFYIEFLNFLPQMNIKYSIFYHTLFLKCR